MVKVGVIAEYNPFHNGHLYHLKKTKEMFPDSTLILVLIGNFTQRGDVSVIDKWNKTKLALKYGFNLVIELPFILATSSASIYARGAIDILNYLDCDYLVFGSETNNVELFKCLALKTLNNDEYENKIKKYLDKGYNYPKACSLALKKETNTMIDKPNDVLAFEYIKSIVKTKSKIKPISIKRTNNYHEENILGKITSATSIRKNLSDIEKIKDSLPEDSLVLIDNVSFNNFFKYLKYEIITNDNLNEVLDVDEGIENKLKKEILNVNSVEELIMRVKSKRYSYNRIKRMLLHILCKTSKNQEFKITYLRILGLDDKGKQLLKEIKNKINVPVITKFKKEHEKLFKEDIKASKLYSLICNYDFNNEFKASIKKESKN